MKTEIKICKISALGAIVLALSACEQSSDSTSEGKIETGSNSVVVPSQPKATTPSVTPSKAPQAPAGATPVSKPPTDPLAPRYEATLEQGIDFRKPGYPTFIKKVEGVSGLGPNPRWSEGNITKIIFNENLPDNFKLEIDALGYGPNIGKNVVVKVGDEERSFTLGLNDKYQKYSLSFDNGRNANGVEFIIPEPISPSEFTKGVSGDPRKIGISFASIKIMKIN